MSERRGKKVKIRIYKRIARLHFDELSYSLNGRVRKVIETYVDGGHPTLDLQTVSWVLKISKTLQFQELKERCLKFFEDLCLLNCPLCIYVTACTYGHEEMGDIALKHVRKNFKALCLTDNFLKLELSRLVTLLDDNYLAIDREFEVFFAALRWLRADWFDRYPLTPLVMKYVRFRLMSEQELEALNQEEFRLVFKFHETLQMLQTALTYVSKVNIDHGLLPPMPRSFRQ